MTLSFVICHLSFSYAQVDIRGSVYGGARQANVGGSTHVTVGADNSDVIINKVFGGSDISGTIGEAKSASDTSSDVTVTTQKESDGKHLFIGQMFSGGNGDYVYTDENGNSLKADGKFIVKDTKGNTLATSITAFVKPELGTASLTVGGGTYGYVYGGGNNATIKESTQVTINNTSSVTLTSDKTGGLPTLTPARLQEMGINTAYYNKTGDYNFCRVFGGNNKADMAIRPTWNLQQGSIENLYSGGNEGRMINAEGLLMIIQPNPENNDNLIVQNVYGGCRKADVRPMEWDNTTNSYKNTIVKNPVGYKFPDELSARLLVRGGQITNVYGGNDVTGQVYGGNAVGIYTSIKGDVYGGGNGSYAYTDNPDLKDDAIWGDFYYDPGESSIDALNAHRPNAEQVSIRVVGSKPAGATDSIPTIIHGAVYVGGNSASLKKTSKTNPMVELKIGSYAIIDTVFLGNNGRNMIAADILKKYADRSFSSINLTNASQMAAYMDGASMDLMPKLNFDTSARDGANYERYTSMVGSFYCGGNVGSMTYEGTNNMDFSAPIYIYNKVVGGCNDAYVEASSYNAAYFGGIRGTAAEQANYQTADGKIRDRLIMNFDGVEIMPLRWDKTGSYLKWNTIDAVSLDTVDVAVSSLTVGESTAADLTRRFDKGNIYGGCYNSGQVNGNVVINLKETIVDRSRLFDEVAEDDEGEAIYYKNYYTNEAYNITKRNSGVILGQQGMDVLGSALNVFGGGYGEHSEVWGSATINLTEGYTFQIFGGGEKGSIGKLWNGSGFDTPSYNASYSTMINLHGNRTGVSKRADSSPYMAECEFIYGGGFEGPVLGDCVVNLGNGRVFNTFAGSCNADIEGHTETWIGRGVALDGSYVNGFPWVRDHIYGGNDLGGEIKREADFETRVRNDNVKGKVFKPGNTYDVLKASAYVEYIQGRVDYIFGGCYGYYDYKADKFDAYTDDDGNPINGFKKPHMVSAFVNFRPSESETNAANVVKRVYGAGQGYPGEDYKDQMQQRSYVLIDIPDAIKNFQDMVVFGAGAFGGVGMYVDQATAKNDQVSASAVIDLMSGTVKNVYGASYEQGVTRRTVVNVPVGSTINVANIFGGAFGTKTISPCDVYESNVNYRSEAARLSGAIYGGNNNERRTVYGHVNIYSPVWSNKEKGYLGTVYGAGLGDNTWSEYTEVNLHSGAQVYEVYGGGQLGKVLCSEVVQKYRDMFSSTLGIPATSWDLAGYYHHDNDYVTNDLTNLTDKNKSQVRKAEIDERADKTYKYNTNVIIHEGATVVNYAYGGGWGDPDKANSGDVYGTTYIALLGGTVVKDIYAAGTSGSVSNRFGAPGLTASATVYVKGGTARNVYGGGWKGSVGYHEGGIDASLAGDVSGETHVVVGRPEGGTFLSGVPAIQRNVYGGGEGGAVYGSSHVQLYNGYVGYVYNAETRQYEEKVDDETWTDHVGLNRLKDSGCVFGGGYIDNSSVDSTFVTMWNGTVRNSLFGGGEIAAIGRGKVTENGTERTLNDIYKAGHTSVKLYKGHVLRNVFGGGRGYNNLGEQGSLFTDGYVFGQTEVDIYGGEIGTDDGLDKGYGNVFGGCDVGYVYSAYRDADGTQCRGKKSGERYDDSDNNLNTDQGYYYKSKKNGDFVIVDDEKILTEDCKVLVEPWCQVTAAGGVKINGTLYAKGDYVPTAALNTLQNKTTSREEWNSLDVDGIIIHNAIFAGGNVSAGSTQDYANATTVFGNATASVHDVFHRDLITVGTGHTGGLYGDGNLTFVDGYRGLNITNYGTDYYYINKEITLDQYRSLPAREAAYYELRYKCIKECTDNAGKTYNPESAGIKASTITTDELIALFDGVRVGGVPMVNADGTPNREYWEENGVCSRYAGRIMNTIQRADFCGVFGSRMVMQGAQDRVPEVADFTNYTINRVREVSLNKKEIGGVVHGNYFGIYNIVNYLGNLTSDVDFGDADGNGDVRTTDNQDTGTYGPTKAGQTFYDWKKEHQADRTRNNGNSHNQVALASGVYLEITREKTELTGDTIWGHITGVIELDLINVQAGVGGGFVYAKNEHGVRRPTNLKHITLTALNEGAATRRDYTYDQTDANKVEWETSGNFVHSTQTIIDDCYPISNRYLGASGMKAHYWYIRGQVYVYNQDISAYTGAPNAYSETVNIPLTITAASHGTMKLLDVKPNRYAYYSMYTQANQKKLGAEETLVINDVTYHLNDPISYWDWYLLSPAEKQLFVPETYVTIADCKIDNDTIHEGTVMLPAEYEQMRRDSVFHISKQKKVAYDFVFRSSNNLGHDTGYILTYGVNNPKLWNKWYTAKDRDETINSEQYAASTSKDSYHDGPTYSPKNTGLYGQQEYTVGSIISKEVYDTYQAVRSNASQAAAIPATGQAEFEPAYIVTSDITLGDAQHLYAGAAVGKSEYTDAQWASISGSVAPAYVCISTIKLAEGEFIYLNSRMTAAQRQKYITDNPEFATDINRYVVPAYYCSTEGLYGGNYYESGKNYRGLQAWCSMSEEDRKNFEFNYDALDLLIDPEYAGKTTRYDGFETYGDDYADLLTYSQSQPVDYSATFNGADNAFTYRASDGSTRQAQHGMELTREEYESLPNEQHHYAPVDVDEGGVFYVVNTAFMSGNTPYSVGTTMTAETYRTLGDNQSNVTQLTFTSPGTYYYCREAYTISNDADGHAVSSINGVTGSYGQGQTVPVGAVISEEAYKALSNKQVNFTIHGIAPEETSTFFVSRNSDIFDLQADKIITVIYQYDYEESDLSGMHITPVSERHVVNIRIKFKSGVPEVENIFAPEIVLPGTSVSMKEPDVKPGAFEVIGGGWEIFENISDAESHTNGVEYSPKTDNLYWYQDGYYMAYYAKSYLGKTYSNAVPVSVANYHDLKRVMDDKQNHYFIDNPGVKRDAKIYINDYSDTGENGLDLLKQFYDLSLLTTAPTTGALAGHSTMDRHVSAGQNLEFILRADIDHSGSAWTPIGNDGQCFSGTLHGDGHLLSGLDHSLFNNLCGDVYNLGVSGSFTGAGIAEKGSGYVENSWISTTSTAAKTAKPVFGEPTGITADRPYRIVNCYYQEEDGAANKYVNHSGTYGTPVRKPQQAFFNGEVAYDLNGFYLYKRYSDQALKSGSAYTYYTENSDNTLKMNTGYYGPYDDTNAPLCSAPYVENRYRYDDFIYAAGTVPEEDDPRRYIDEETGISYYFPLWPDDYIFFGQALNYGFVDGMTHQDWPTAIRKSGNRLPDDGTSNRVYRASAYYGSSQKSKAYYNPDAVFAQSKNGDAAALANKGMTAIDFSGYGDVAYAKGNSAGIFYPPLLDNDGLTGFHNVDLTRNLLVYTRTGTAADDQTNSVVSLALSEKAYSETDDIYRTVDFNDATYILGHHVVKTDDGYQAMGDHQLVDKQEFNAPIAYTFSNGFRMWYQREPDRYVDLVKGWEDICLPFTADLVTTETKGEITHFFEGSTTGHEYWLRAFKGNVGTPDANGIATADFKYPELTGSDASKRVTNTFLWDYYYEATAGHNQKDKNGDTYQTYYNSPREYEQYPRLTASVPYVIGFPGPTYYEFDLSGVWSTSTTALPNPARQSVQAITFASASGVTIGVTDEIASGVTLDGFTFHNNFTNREFATAGEAYLLNSDGSAYQKTAAGARVSAFRPYFTGASAARTRGIEQIVFNQGDSSFGNEDRQDPRSGEAGTLSITAEKGRIVVSSSLRYTTDVRIVNPAGISLRTFTVRPGETIETPVLFSGIYIVRSEDGIYTKKLSVMNQ